MNSTTLDRDRLRLALQLAESAIGVTEPNPRVGCVIGDENGAILGCGATQKAGGPHAEVVALRAAAAQGHDVRGATAWVTLEPCAHHGRTPPCCDALISAGLKRVVAAVEDPFPQVAGAGLARLRAAGVHVDMANADIGAAAWALNVGFFSRMLRGRPWVRMKMAASLDGRSALDNGVSQWITGAAARADGHAWRKRASAVLTGIGTVLADDPRLDVRLVASEWHPMRVVVDSALRIAPDARLFDPPGAVLLATAQPDEARQQALTARGAEIRLLPDRNGRVDLAALLRLLAERGVNEVHVEAGPQLNSALLRAGLVDELLLYLAPRLLGGGRGLVDWPALDRLDQGLEFEWIDCVRLGPDLRARLRPGGSAFGPGAVSKGTSELFTSGLTPE